MNTNTIFILVSDLEENSFSKMPRLKSPQISFQQLVGRHHEGSRKFSMEDIFIGTTATWPYIKQRIEEYLQLAYLREGSLEIIYYSAYDSLMRFYTNDADNYFHFYDACICRTEIEQLVQSFPTTFTCDFINRSNEEIEVLGLSAKDATQKVDKYGFGIDFLTISNSTPNEQWA